ncbi:hypothetical protein BH23ACT10_BH23ACT10_20750 [soil metagenome]
MTGSRDCTSTDKVALFTGEAIFTEVVNMTYVVNIVGELEARVLRILRGLPGVNAVVEPVAVADAGADAVVRLADRELPIVVKVRSRVNAATARQLVDASAWTDGVPVLVIAEETTADARATLREHGVGFVDADGHAHIELPGVLIHTDGASGNRDDRKVSRPMRLSGKAGVAAQALLAQPDRAWKVTDLADAADVSSGLAHRVLARLEQDGVVGVEGAGPSRVRHVVNAAALLELWAEEQQDKPRRTRAHLLGQTPSLVAEQLCAGLDDAGIDYALTGPAAASIVAPFVTAVPVVDVWVAATADPDRVCAAVDAEQVPTGHNILFNQARDDHPLVFRKRIDDRWIVNPFRLYLDLRANPQRGVEQAAHLRREAIGF